MLLSFMTAVVFAQDRTVTGKVTSAEDGTELPGVNVVVKGTTVGTTTSADGTYSLQLPSSGGTLVFSFIGLQTSEEAVGDRTVIDVTLAADVTQLSEVVVVGYGTTERRKLASSVSSVQGAAISKLATPSFVDQLAGRSAGVQIGVNTGVIGQAPTINIRGISSISSGTTPLIVIDGVPMTTGNQSTIIQTNPLADINPSDIESYDILKDGAATAIYGSRAANGVILITTKRGTKNKGKAKVDFTATTGYAEAVKTFDLLKADEFVTIVNQKLANAGQAPRAFNDPTNPTSGETDWQKTLLRKGAFKNYNLNMGGANETTNYYFSLGYQSQQSTVRANDFERFSVRANADHRVNKFLKIGTSTQFTRGITNGLNTGTNALSGNISGGIRAFPNVTIYDEANPTGYNLTSDGAALGRGANTLGITSSWTNQAFVLTNNKFRATNDRLLANAYGQVDIIDGLSFKSFIGIDYLGNKDFQSLDPRHGDGRGQNGSITQQFRTVTTWNWQNTVNYNKDFGVHGVDVVAGLEYQKTITSSFNASGANFADRAFMQENLISGTFATPTSFGTYVPTGFQSVFGRVNYSLADKYLLGVSIRRDGISSLAKDQRFGVFPGVSLGYRIAEEDFFKESNIKTIVNDLKIRASYAQVGNTSIGSFPYQTLFGAAKYGTQNGVGFTQAGNPPLTWETSKKTNIGADFSFLNNRLSLSVDWFRNDIDNLILNVPYPPSLGVPNPNFPNTIPQNVGTIRNNGIEFTVNATAMQRGSFTWNISANFTKVTNEVLSTFKTSAGTDADVFSTTISAYQIAARVGEPINVIYGYTYAGVNPANGFPLYEKGNGTLVQRNVAGSGAYSVYDPANPTSTATAATLSASDVAQGGDRKVLGRTTPTWFGGVTNNFAWKGFNLEVFARYSGGNKIYNQTKQDVLYNMDFTNSGTGLRDSWTPENPNTNVPKMYYLGNSQVNQSGAATTRFVESGNFLRIQNIVLGYSLPKTLFDNAGEFKGTTVRVFAQVQNAFTFTKYTGLDPELGVLNNGISTGFDNNVSPLSRIYTVGLNIGF